MKEENKVTVQTNVHATVEKVWKCWTLPEHIVNWNFASDEWHCPRADNDIRPGGKLNWRMEAKDESAGFDFTGIYLKVEKQKLLQYQMDDKRIVVIQFEETDGKTSITETFEVEDINTKEMQKMGWQTILDNFKAYVESNK